MNGNEHCELKKEEREREIIEKEKESRGRSLKDPYTLSFVDHKILKGRTQMNRTVAV
jgi:hypothetical protein